MTVIARPLDWQAVFGSEHPHASFHDATLTRLEVDYLARRATFSLRVWVGDPDAEERSMRQISRTGKLVVTGLLFCALDPPDRRCLYEYPQGLVGLGGLWIADDGEVTEEQPAGAASKLPLPLPSDAFLHYFFLNDWNSFIYIAGREATFQWDPENEHPA